MVSGGDSNPRQPVLEAGHTAVVTLSWIFPQAYPCVVYQSPYWGSVMVSLLLLL